MSGTAVIASLLITNEAVTAIVPADRIMPGLLPLNSLMPAINVRQISSVPYNNIAVNEPNKLHTDRVQITAFFKTPEGTPSGTGYPGLDALLKLTLVACRNRRGTINGIRVDSITPDIAGPDNDDLDFALVYRTRDFIVRWIDVDSDYLTFEDLPGHLVTEGG